MSGSYTYEAFTRSGDEIHGSIEAENESEVRTVLGQQNLLVMKVNQIGGDSLAKKEFNLRKKASVKDIAWLARSLATTQASGLPVYPALAILARQRAKEPIGKILTRVHKKVGDGASLTGAFREESDKVGELSCAMIEAGEVSGRLDESLEHLATITESRLRIKRKIRSAMMYPIVVIFIAGSMATGMLTMIVPQFEEIYSQLGGQLPLPTRIVIGLSHLMIKLWWAYPLVLAGIVATVVQFQRSPKLKLKWHKAILKFPIFGKLIHKAAFARLTLVLSSLMNSGVGLLEALTLAGNASGNMAVAEALQRVHDKVREGSSLAAAMKGEPLVPEVMTELVSMGEDTGTVPSLLDRYGKTLDDEVTTAVDGLTSLMEPLLIVVLGGIIGSLVVAFWLPILNAPKLIEQQGG
ncbi:MAG TPA: type II secretion system F family protein [Acidimicrobiia bacterium]|nr:type II secretion system F family protein [Acidimicrobiia bacterium]